MSFMNLNIKPAREFLQLSDIFIETLKTVLWNRLNRQNVVSKTETPFNSLHNDNVFRYFQTPHHKVVVVPHVTVPVLAICQHRLLTQFPPVLAHAP